MTIRFGSFGSTLVDLGETSVERGYPDDPLRGTIHVPGGIMTRKLIAVLAAAVLPAVLLAPPAHAADTVIVVDGHGNLGAHLLPWTNKCGEPNYAGNQSPTKLVSDDSTLGGESLGWDFTAAGNEAGALIYRSDNTAVTSTSVDVLGMGDTIKGHAIALFDWYASDFVGGYYVGVGNEFNFAVDGWQTLTHTSYNWYLVDNNFDKIEGTETTGTIAQMRDWDGTSSGVYTGFVVGCNTQSFYLDKLRVTLGANTLTYDLETPQIESMAHVEYSPDGQRVRDGNVTINYGKRLRILGHAHGHHDDVYFQANGSLWAQPFGKSWRRIATKSFDPDFYASFAQRPERRTVYYFATSADAIHSAATSEYMVVNVRARASIKILDRTLVEGQRITALGVMKPSNRGQKLKLQRRVNGTWKTFASGRTGRDGKYRFSGVASSPGTWKVRVLVLSGNGNLGTKTAARYVTVEKYVPPPPKPDDNEVVYIQPTVPNKPAPPAPDPTRRSIVSARELTVRVGQAPPAR